MAATCSASIPPGTFEELREMRVTVLWNKCANCLVFGWEQVKPESLQKCGRCKVLQYCSKECQAEHWALVHKVHCQKMAWARQSDESVGIFSQDPFPDPEVGVQSETTLVLVDIIQKVLVRLKSSNPAAFLHIDQLPKLEAIMEMNRMWCYANRKVFPEQLKAAHDVNEGGNSPDHPLFRGTCKIQLNNEASQNIWSSLHLVWGRLIDWEQTVSMSSLKDPRQAMPLDAWEDFIEEDVGLFSVRLKELLIVFNSKFISFKELLKAWCGGSLVQHCSFCDTTMTVEAVYGEVKGCKRSVAAVSLRPNMTPMHCCGAPACEEEMNSKVKAWWKWRVAVSLAHNKLLGNSCNFCFKLSEEVHR